MRERLPLALSIAALLVAIFGATPFGRAAVQDTVRYALYAKNAGTAQKAKKADVATKAKKADTATKAKKADTATKAKKADTATRATKAKEAETATKAKEADTATKAKLAEDAEKVGGIAVSVTPQAGKLFPLAENGKLPAAVVPAPTPGTSGTPVAYASIAESGAVYKGTPNVTSAWNATQNWFEITLAGQNYYFLDYVTVVTPNAAVISTVSSLDGKLIVYFTSTAGTRVTTPTRFEFITYKP